MPPSSPLEPAIPATALQGVALDNPPPLALLSPRPGAGGRGRGESAATEAAAAEDDLLSPAYVRVDRAFDLSTTAQEASARVSPLATLPDDQVVVLELVEDGGTAITTVGQVRQRQDLWLAASADSLQRGVAPTRLFSRLYTLTFGTDDVEREVEEQVKTLARDRLGKAVEEEFTIRGSWLATKLLLQRIEDRLPCPPGLHRWRGGTIGSEAPLQADDPALQAEAAKGLLVFVHGTGSSTQGSFGELATPAVGVWPLLEGAFGERIYGFEQHTFSVSPIDNALALARSLPAGARLTLVSHGSGGLVADLLGAAGIDEALIEAYRYPPAKEEELSRQRDAAAADQREQLRELRGVLAKKAFRIERYLRVASPASGSRLLGDNLDIVLSVLLSLISSLPALAGQPVVAVLKRVVLDVVRRRLDPCLVPGLAAMAPDAPLAHLLAGLPPRSDLAMATIAGHREGRHPLQQLVLLFSDTACVQRCPNALVADVSPFPSFSRPARARALARWLTEGHPLELDEFRPLASPPAKRERATTLRVSCHAMDLRYLNQPVMVGHYENDSIAAAEALIDRDLVAGALSRRHRLGLYAGPRGSSTVVLMPPSARERGQGSCRGAVVIGLGPMGDLSSIALTEAVRVGTLRYLLQLLDRGDGGAGTAGEVGLASLLIGQNSTNTITIEESVMALVEGVLAANAQFANTFAGVAPQVGHLRLVELHLDTAITATRALARLDARLNRDGQRVLSLERELQFGKGWRHRLDAAEELGYWPRLMITNGEPAGHRLSGNRFAGQEGNRHPGVKLADTLNFSFLGQRARAETQWQQRQSGLVEALVAASIQTPTLNNDLSRTLFQLLVPSTFKELARQLDQLVLVLDDTTANLPWELLMADDKPLALQLAVVRQLQAPRYRQQLHQTTDRAAYVIGNPSSEGFFDLFVGAGGPGSTGLASLDGARQEAESVLTLLRQSAYACEDSLQEENAVDVINKLYRHPYRLLHIAGHGVFEHPTHQGERRSGVVLAGGLLLTAAEIEAMEVVPDLVFLNCCHLGTVKREAVAFNRLAASVAGQLIAMGVRAVVACGWAVEDAAALAFAEAFYTAMLRGIPFGNAVFLARKAAHATLPDSTTWGAYQAYGDPDYRLEEPLSSARQDPHPTAAGAGVERFSWVTPLELIDRLQQLEVRVRHDTSQPSVHHLLLAELEAVLKAAPPTWLGQAEVAVAVADVHAAFGGEQREEACRYYLAAIRCHQATDGLPIRAIEQLANLEARLGEQNDDEPRVEAAIERLRALLRLAGVGSGEAAAAAAMGPPEWQGLLGSACKRLAALRARALVASSGRPNKDALQAMLAPLEEAIAAYGLASGDVYNRLNHLALEAVRALPEPADARAIRRAKALLEEQRRGAPADPSFWSAVAIADALLVWRLVDRHLAAADARGESAAQEVLEGYQEVFANVRSTPLERASVLEQLSLLGDLARARGESPTDPCPAGALLARRLEAIGHALRESEAATAPPAAEGDSGEGDAGKGADVIERLS